MCLFCYCKSPLHTFQANILFHSLTVIVLLNEKDPFRLISKSIVGQVCAVAKMLFIVYRQLSASDCSRNESCKLTCFVLQPDEVSWYHNKHWRQEQDPLHADCQVYRGANTAKSEENFERYFS